MKNIVDCSSPQLNSSPQEKTKPTLHCLSLHKQEDHEMIHPSISERKPLSPTLNPISSTPLFPSSQLEKPNSIYIALENSEFPKDPASLPLFLHYSQFRCNELAVDELSCPICKDVLFKAKVTDNGDDALSIDPCGHVFCVSCITKWLESHDYCPSCRSPLSLSQIRTDVRTQRLAADLPVHCMNAKPPEGEILPLYLSHFTHAYGFTPEEVLKTLNPETTGLSTIFDGSEMSDGGAHDSELNHEKDNESLISGDFSAVHISSVVPSETSSVAADRPTLASAPSMPSSTDISSSTTPASCHKTTPSEASLRPNPVVLYQVFGINEGCDWVGRLGKEGEELSTHQLSCPYTPVRCPWSINSESMTRDHGEEENKSLHNANNLTSVTRSEVQQTETAATLLETSTGDTNVEVQGTRIGIQGANTITSSSFSSFLSSSTLEIPLSTTCTGISKAQIWDSNTGVSPSTTSKSLKPSLSQTKLSTLVLPGDAPQKDVCNAIVLRKDLAYHRSICPLRPLRCDVCGGDYLACQEEEHRLICPFRLVLCPNNCFEDLYATPMLPGDVAIDHEEVMRNSLGVCGENNGERNHESLDRLSGLADQRHGQLPSQKPSFSVSISDEGAHIDNNHDEEVLRSKHRDVEIDDLEITKSLGSYHFFPTRLHRISDVGVDADTGTNVDVDQNASNSIGSINLSESGSISREKNAHANVEPRRLRRVHLCDVDFHLEHECMNSLVTCPFARMGCGEKVPRISLSSHSQDYSIHFSLLQQYCETVEQENMEVRLSAQRFAKRIRELELALETSVLASRILEQRKLIERERGREMIDMNLDMDVNLGLSIGLDIERERERERDISHAHGHTISPDGREESKERETVSDGVFINALSPRSHSHSHVHSRTQSVNAIQNHKDRKLSKDQHEHECERECDRELHFSRSHSLNHNIAPSTTNRNSSNIPSSGSVPVLSRGQSLSASQLANRVYVHASESPQISLVDGEDKNYVTSDDTLVESEPVSNMALESVSNLGKKSGFRSDGYSGSIGGEGEVTDEDSILSHSAKRPKMSPEVATLSTKQRQMLSLQKHRSKQQQQQQSAIPSNQSSNQQYSSQTVLTHTGSFISEDSVGYAHHHSFPPSLIATVPVHVDEPLVQQSKELCQVNNEEDNKIETTENLRSTSFSDTSSTASSTSSARSKAFVLKKRLRDNNPAQPSVLSAQPQNQAQNQAQSQPQAQVPALAIADPPFGEYTPLVAFEGLGEDDVFTTVISDSEESPTTTEVKIPYSDLVETESQPQPQSESELEPKPSKSSDHVLPNGLQTSEQVSGQVHGKLSSQVASSTTASSSSSTARPFHTHLVLKKRVGSSLHPSMLTSYHSNHSSDSETSHHQHQHQPSQLSHSSHSSHSSMVAPSGTVPSTTPSMSTISSTTSLSTAMAFAQSADRMRDREFREMRSGFRSSHRHSVVGNSTNSSASARVSWLRERERDSNLAHLSHTTGSSGGGFGTGAGAGSVSSVLSHTHPHTALGITESGSIPTTLASVVTGGVGMAGAAHHLAASDRFQVLEPSHKTRSGNIHAHIPKHHLSHQSSYTNHHSVGVHHYNQSYLSSAASPASTSSSSSSSFYYPNITTGGSYHTHTHASPHTSAIIQAQPVRRQPYHHHISSTGATGLRNGTIPSASSSSTPAPPSASALSSYNSPHYISNTSAVGHAASLPRTSSSSQFGHQNILSHSSNPHHFHPPLSPHQRESFQGPSSVSASPSASVPMSTSGSSHHQMGVVYLPSGEQNSLPSPQTAVSSSYLSYSAPSSVSTMVFAQNPVSSLHAVSGMSNSTASVKFVSKVPSSSLNRSSIVSSFNRAPASGPSKPYRVVETTEKNVSTRIRPLPGTVNVFPSYHSSHLARPGPPPPVGSSAKLLSLETTTLSNSNSYNNTVGGALANTIGTVANGNNNNASASIPNVASSTALSSLSSYSIDNSGNSSESSPHNNGTFE